MAKGTPFALLLALPLVAFASGCARRNAVEADPSTVAPIQAATPGSRMVGGPYENLHGVGACENNCLLHEIGYQWAQTHGVTDASQCGGDNEEMVEGCEAYAEDQQ